MRKRCLEQREWPGQRRRGRTGGEDPGRLLGWLEGDEGRLLWPELPSRWWDSWPAAPRLRTPGRDEMRPLRREQACAVAEGEQNGRSLWNDLAQKSPDKGGAASPERSLVVSFAQLWAMVKNRGLTRIPGSPGWPVT